jgi:hypothetical protein
VAIPAEDENRGMDNNRTLFCNEVQGNPQASVSVTVRLQIAGPILSGKHDYKKIQLLKIILNLAKHVNFFAFFCAC